MRLCPSVSLFLFCPVEIFIFVFRVVVQLADVLYLLSMDGLDLYDLYDGVQQSGPAAL